ncbi:MAG: hypothetical protein Q4C70_14345, partial [Planctomycetia bacterium]|nr:hypothetical protein [Planctomycetia bacterium]
MDSPAVEDTSEMRLPFRRVYIPEEMLPAIPTHGEAYWPIPAEEFELWATQKIHGTQENAHHSRTVFAEEAVYEAKLVENRFFTGTATFRLRKLPTLAHLSAATTLTGNGISYTWDFPPVSFAFDNFLNVQPEEKLPFSRRNFKFSPSGAGEVTLQTDDFRVDGIPTETLSPDGICHAELGWSQSVTPIENGVLRLDLSWIPATDTQYVFTLPAEWIPETDEGIITLNLPENESETETKTALDPAAGNAAGSTAGSAADVTSDTASEKISDTNLSPSMEIKTGVVTDWQTWRISFGGRQRATVIFRRKDAPKLQDAPISVSQKNIYQFRKEGMDVFVQMNLNSLLESAKFSTKPTRELRVLMENHLIPQKIRFNEVEVPWKSEVKTVSETENTSENGTVVTIFLPEELQGAGNRLEINAIGNLDTWLAEGMIGLRALPRVQLLNSLRRGCRTEVQVYSPLEIVDFSLKDAVILANQQKPGLEQTQLEFIEYSDVARFEMMLARLTPKLRIDQATAINFQEHEISAVMELQASVDSGECFEILGLVDRSWTIDAVESGEVTISDISGKSGESGTIEDWNLDVSPGNVHQALSDLDPTGALPGKLTASGWNLDSLGILRIQLAHSIRPGYPISLKIRARRLGYANNFTFTGIQLTPLYFPACQIGQSWLVCGSSTTWKVHFIPPYREQDVYWTAISAGPERRFMPGNGEAAHSVHSVTQVTEKPEIVAETSPMESTPEVGIETDSGTETGLITDSELENGNGNGNGN